MTISMTFLASISCFADSSNDERGSEVSCEFVATANLRHDFYQSPTDVTISIYVKGYNTPSARENIKIDYHTHSVDVSLPALENVEAKSFTLGPLAGAIAPGDCSERVLGTKVGDST